MKDCETIGQGCTRCGDCCKEFQILMPFDEDIGMFHALHGAVVRQVGKQMTVGYRLMCVMYNPTEGKCNTYETRPKICREYLCDRALGKTLKFRERPPQQKPDGPRIVQLEGKAESLTETKA